MYCRSCTLSAASRRLAVPGSWSGDASAPASMTFHPARPSSPHAHQANLREQVVPAPSPDRPNKRFCGGSETSAMQMPEQLPGKQDLGNKRDESTEIQFSTLTSIAFFPARSMRRARRRRSNQPLPVDSSAGDSFPVSSLPKRSPVSLPRPSSDPPRPVSPASA